MPAPPGKTCRPQACSRPRALPPPVRPAIALAQTAAPPAPLPPLSVEAKQPKKKADDGTRQESGRRSVAPAAAAAPTPAQKGSNPYANPDAPYKVEQSASGKLTEPLVNTPRTVTVTPKEVIEDKSARDLRDLARSTPGLTIGSAEGGNSYGAFAIRGFKANNDIFVDSIRNPGNVIPDVFSVQQVEIYKGPSGGIAGRSTIGGAVNIISKEPDLRSSFYESHDHARHRQDVPHDARCQPEGVAGFRGARQPHVRPRMTLPDATLPTANAGAGSSRPRDGCLIP